MKNAVIIALLLNTTYLHCMEMNNAENIGLGIVALGTAGLGIYICYDHFLTDPNVKLKEKYAQKYNRESTNIRIATQLEEAQKQTKQTKLGQEKTELIQLSKYLSQLPNKTRSDLDLERRVLEDLKNIQKDIPQIS